MADSLMVKDIMTRDVVSAYPETTVLQAHEIISFHRFNGLPVVDNENHIVGIITQQDLLSRGSGIHLPTLQKFFAELPVYKKDSKEFKKEIYELSRLTVRQIMNPDPLTISENASLREMVEMFREHSKVNPIPVADKDNKLVGIISRSDALKLFYVVKLTQ